MEQRKALKIKRILHAIAKNYTAAKTKNHPNFALISHKQPQLSTNFLQKENIREDQNYMEESYHIWRSAQTFSDQFGFQSLSLWAFDFRKVTGYSGLSQFIHQEKEMDHLYFPFCYFDCFIR